MQQRYIYDLVRTGYGALFHLNDEDANFLDKRVSEVRSAATTSGQPVIGMHIRRGDRHPFQREFSGDYLPLDRFTSAAQKQLQLHASASEGKSDIPPTFLLASDDPDIIINNDLLSTLPAPLSLSRAQDRIVLASKRTLEPAVPFRAPGSAYTKHVDENSGWEGGFYAALFNSLGRPRGGAAVNTDPDARAQIDQQVAALRALVGRAYLLDLAVLATSDAVVCASSSAGCRVLGVMMGWDRVNKGDWVNVDDKRFWSWDGKK